MANAVIGALRVNLGLDSAQFSNGLKTARSRLDSFGAMAVKAFAAVAAAGVAMAGALAVGIKRTIDEADNLSKSAQKFGVPVEELSRLKHAADLSGVSFEGLGTGLRKLSQNMQEFANGAKNQASQAFQALGISVTNADGSLKSSSAVMTEIAGKLSMMEDGAQKTATMMAIFGRSGADLIPMLNQGADGLAAMMAEADQLGIVLDSNTARAAENFNDNLTRMGRIKDGLILKITAELLPALESMSEKFLEFANTESMVSAAADGIGGAIQWVARQIGQASIIVARLTIEINGLLAAMGRLKELDFSGAAAAFLQGQDASAKMRDDMDAMLNEVFSGAATSQAGIQRRISDAFGESGAGAGEKFVAEFEKATAGGGGRAKVALDPMVREAARIFEATRTPLEQYQAQIARLNELLAAGAINQDTYNRAVLQAQDAFQKAEDAGKKTKGTLASIGESLASTFSSAFQGLIDKSKKIKDVLKDLARQLSQMLLNKGFQALFGGLFGGGGFLGKLFGGLPGFANGGSFNVGGAGGIDSQVVAFRASPNERVDITKPGQERGGGGTYAPVYNIDARGADQAAITRLERGLAERDRTFAKRVDLRNKTSQTRGTRP